MIDDRQSGTQDCIDGLDQLQQSGAIDADEQNMLIRHLADHKRAMDEAMLEITPEYERRIAQDGQASADEWLASTAQALGEKHGAATRQVLGSLNVNQGDGL